MTAQDKNLHTIRSRPWQRQTLAEYVRRRNGVPLGDSRSLRNMLIRSFGAGSFGQFWQYWNPIFGYGLGKYVYSPLQRFLPPALALVMTLIESGVPFVGRRKSTISYINGAKAGAQAQEQRRRAYFG